MGRCFTGQTLGLRKARARAHFKPWVRGNLHQPILLEEGLFPSYAVVSVFTFAEWDTPQVWNRRDAERIL